MESLTPAEISLATIKKVYGIDLSKLPGLCEALNIGKQEKVDISAYAKSLNLSEEEARQAIEEWARRKARAQQVEDEEKDGNPEDARSKAVDEVSRKVLKKLREAKPAGAEQTSTETVPDEGEDQEAVDNDEYAPPVVSLRERIARKKREVERELQEFAEEEGLREKLGHARPYTLQWLRLLMELESREQSGTSGHNRSVTLHFGKVERDGNTERTLIFSHPDRYIPYYLEDLPDLKAEIEIGNELQTLVLESVSVKSYTLKAKVRDKEKLAGIELSLCTGATIQVQSTTFLFGALVDAFGTMAEEQQWGKDYDLQQNLPHNIEFIFGPPGTGKTTELANQVVSNLLADRQNVRVLCLAPTNKAADVLARAIMEKAGGANTQEWLLRFGGTNDEELEDNGIFQDKAYPITEKCRNVTVTTMARLPYDYFLLEGNKRMPLIRLNWDYVVIDEASMIHLPWMLYALYRLRPHKFIIAGDPFQIQPITSIDLWQDENIYILTGLKSFKNPQTVPMLYPIKNLQIQYRSLPAIGDVVGKFTYDGLLKHARSEDEKSEILLGNKFVLKPLTIIKFPVKEYESIYKARKTRGGSAYHIYSALFAREFTKSLCESLPADRAWTIGVIAPYRIQANLLNKLTSGIGSQRNVTISADTVHSFQGDSCDIIVALFNPQAALSASNNIFLNKQNILNVAISRAKDILIILMPDEETKNIERLERVREIEALCNEKGCAIYKAQDMEGCILGSSTWLEENTFSTSHQPVNVYTRPEKFYEVRSEDSSIDVQIFNEGEES